MRLEVVWSSGGFDLATIFYFIPANDLEINFEILGEQSSIEMELDGGREKERSDNLERERSNSHDTWL